MRYVSPFRPFRSLTTYCTVQGRIADPPALLPLDVTVPFVGKGSCVAPRGWWEIFKDPGPHQIAFSHWSCFPRLTLLETSALAPPGSFQPLLACMSGFTQAAAQASQEMNLKKASAIFIPKSLNSPNLAPPMGCGRQSQMCLSVRLSSKTPSRRPKRRNRK